MPTEDRSPPRTGIGARLAAAIVVIVLVATLPATLWTLNHSRDLAEKHARESVLSLLRHDAGLMRLSVTNRDHWHLYNLVSAVAAPAHVAEAVVLDHSSRVLAHSHPDRHPLLSHWPGIGDRPAEEIIIGGLRGEIGRLIVIWNEEKISADFAPARHSLLWVSGVSALLAAALGMVVAWSMRRRLHDILRTVQTRDTLAAVRDLRQPGTTGSGPEPRDELTKLKSDLVRAVDGMHLARWVLDRVDEVVLLVDRCGEVIFCSMAMQRTGCPRASCAGASLHAMLHPEHRNGILDLVREQRAGTVETSTPLGRDCFPFPALVSCQPQEDDLALVTIKDIGEIQSLRKRMNRLHALSALGDMATEVAHEIKNDVVPVRLLCEMSSMEEEDRRAVVRSLNHLDELVNDFMAFCCGVHNSDAKRMPLLALIREAAETISHTARERDVTIELAVGEDAPEIPAGGIRIVISNLIRNAVQAAPRGGWVRVRTQQKNPQAVQLEVADNGPGVPAELQERLFEPFVTTKQGGTGLGLALVYRYVSLAGGAIYYCTAAEGGAVFTVNWPLQASAHMPP